MRDTTMIKISLILILLGLPTLAALSHYNMPELDNTMIFSDQEIIHINGTILSTKNKATTTTALLETCTQIPLVMFDQVRLDSQREVQIIAKKDSYKGKQLLVEELTYI